MTATLKVEIKGSIFNARGHAKVMRVCYRNRMEFIRDALWPTHFELNSMTRPGGDYGYPASSRAYMIKKARVKGHQKPLVYSGNMRNAVLGNSIVRATQYRGTLTAKGTYPMTPERRGQIEVVTEGQKGLLASGFQDLYLQCANLPEFKSALRQRAAR